MKLNTSVVFPAFNEAKNLPTLLNETIQFLEKAGWDFEIILVNDGSSDNSKEILNNFSQDPRIKPIHHEKNKGYGEALKSGFSAATKDWIFLMDSDRQFDIKELSKLVEFTPNFDLIIGYRIDRKDNSIRKLNAWIYHKVIWILFGLNVKDIDCAFKLMRRDIIQKLNLESSGAFISSELLIKSKRLRSRIKEISINHYPRVAGNPTGANLNVILRAMREVIRFRLTGHL